MNVQPLFADVPLAKFIAEYLHRLPFSLAGSAQSVCQLGNWDAFGEMLAGAEGDLFATRAGQWYAGPPITQLEAVRALLDDGHTLFIRHAERRHAGLAELAAAFECTFRGPVNVHVFVTPAAQSGFSWHYDAEDVFIIQTQGAKEYSLRKNTVNPWPLEETLPADMQYERELMPLMRVLLHPGDLLYIPCGWWHKAEARASSSDFNPSTTNDGLKPALRAPGEAAISLAIGVMSRSAIDVYDFLRRRLVQSLVWRQRLPLPDAAQISGVELEAAYRHLFAQLADDLAKTLADPRLVREFLDQFEQPKGVDDGKASPGDSA
jgi:hypothetical protein